MGPLLMYHVLLLAGGFVVIAGYLRHSFPWTVLGWALIVGGILIELTILWWSVRLVRRQPVDPAPSASSIGSPGPGAGPARWICVACGWRGPEGNRFCPRCGKVMVRLPTGPGTTPTAPQAT
ncbi:MAG: hypothetical protein WA761_07470 [Thermoplasmata archaeon]